MLNTKDEEPVWDCCLKWIEYDSKNRLKYLTKLMRGVRLGLLNTRVSQLKFNNITILIIYL